MSSIKIHKNKTWARKSTEYCEYDFPVESKNAEPEFRWQHGKISMEEWHKVLSFFKWSYDETKSETQVRLLYNPETKHWVAWAFPQEHGTGMTTKEIDNDQMDEQRARLVGYTNMGTVHHHCSTSAFQSSVDEANERTQDGIHITIGHMDRDIYDIDARVCWGDLKYDCCASDWFGHPEAWDSIPEFARFIDSALKDYLSKPPEEPSFPEEWEGNLIKKTYPTTTYSGFNHGLYRGGNIHRQTHFRHGAGSQIPSNPQSSLLPVVYTETEKMNALYEAIRKFTQTHGKALSLTSTADLANDYDAVLLSEYYIELFEIVNKYDISEDTYMRVCDKLDDEEQSIAAAQEQALEDAEEARLQQEARKNNSEIYYTDDYAQIP